VSTTPINVDIDFLMAMRHSPIRNYVVPGITSWLIGAHHATNGCVRMLQCSRNQIESVAPHDHRFSFHAIVLAGRVTNRLWVPDGPGGDLYQSTTLQPTGVSSATGPRYLKHATADVGGWRFQDTDYEAGQSYGMAAHEVHSITFRRGTTLLIFEGRQEKTCSMILEPVVDGMVKSSFHVEPWMFEQEARKS
jgi:hypothetical protein